MNTSDKFKFIWWGTAGCGSRATATSLTELGADDLYNNVEKMYNNQGGSFTHHHGFPKGKEDWPVICNVRNPYSLVVSGYLDILTEYKQKGKSLDFKDYLINHYFQEESLHREDPFFLNKWKTFHKEPEYIIHLETMDDDLRKLPFFNEDGKMNEVINEFVYHNRYKNESPYDEYEGRFQKYQLYYNQEVADIVYDNMKEYFIKFGYDKDSWK